MKARAMTPEHAEWTEFVRRLSSLGDGLGPPLLDRCDHTFDRATGIIVALGFDVPASLDFLRQHGAACDCEILFNVNADVNPEPRETLEQTLESLRARYEESRDGMLVWAAVSHAHFAEAPLPDWCRKYLFETATALSKARHVAREGRADAVVAALGVARALDLERKGPGRRPVAGARDLKLAWSVYAERLERGVTYQEAVARVAETEAVSESTVKAAYSRFREEVLAAAEDD